MKIRTKPPPIIKKSPIEAMPTPTGIPYTNSYGSTLDNYSSVLGTELSTALNVNGAVCGISGRWIGGILLAIACMVIAGAGVAMGHETAGLIIGSLVLLCGIFMGIIPLYIVLLLVSIPFIWFVLKHIVSA